MKFKLLQTDFLPILNSISRCVGVKANLPVLGNILFSIENDQLKLAATNLEIGIVKFVKAEILESGEVTVPAKTLLETISGLSGLEVLFETTGDLVTISAGKFKASINGISSNEFPVIPTSNDFLISFPKAVLKGCSTILFAAALDEARPILTGVLMQNSKEKLDFVATDGFRLAHHQVKLTNGSDFKCLIPKRTFEELIRLTEEEEFDQIEMAISKDQNQIIFKVGQALISSRLIEGNYPSWEKIIPVDIKSRTLVDKQLFNQAVKLASIFAKNEANILNLKVLKSQIQISSETKEIGSQQNEVEASTEGTELEIAFSAKFLNDVVSNINSSQLMIEFSGPLSATLIKPVGEEGLEYILMSVRTS